MTATDGFTATAGHGAGAAAGWYPDPLNRSEIRWWDGQCWGPTATEARERWQATRGRPYPAQESSGRPGPAGAGEDRGGRQAAATLRRRSSLPWWFWVLLVGGMPFWLLVLPALFDPVQWETDWVYAEDFSTGAGEFDVWEEPEGQAGVEDGRYVVTNRYSGHGLQVWVYTPWPANRLQIEAAMQLTDATDSDGFGLVLQRWDRGVYTMEVSPADGVSISGPDLRCEEQPSAKAGRGGRLALGGEYGDDAITLTASIDGRPVVTCTDETGRINGGAFRAAALWLYADDEPATAEVDDATITAHKY